jgi:hypothetical protein
VTGILTLESGSGAVLIVDGGNCGEAGCITLQPDISAIMISSPVIPFIVLVLRFNTIKSQTKILLKQL